MSSQGIVVKKFFTQDKLKPDDADKPLSLQHRAWFLLYSYVTLFLNLLYGLIFAVLRIVIGVIISVILLPRIDRPIWAPGVGDKDLVYVLYAGNLYTENAHSNPILVMFCHLMVFDILNPKRKQLRMSQLHRQMSDKGLINSQAPSYTDLESTSTETERPHLLRFFRWHLAYTLINNPSVIRLRKSTAVLPDQEVMISEGEARFVNAGKGNRGHQMLPHMMEVMKRQNSGLRDMSEVAPTVTRPSVNAVDPELIVIEDLPAIPQSPGNSSLLVSPLLPIEDSQLQSGPTSESGNPAKPGRGEKGLHTADSESTA